MAIIRRNRVYHNLCSMNAKVLNVAVVVDYPRLLLALGPPHRVDLEVEGAGQHSEHVTVLVRQQRHPVLGAANARLIKLNF